MKPYMLICAVILLPAVNLLYSAEFYYDLDFKSNRLENVADPVEPMDAANKEYVDVNINELSGWTDDGTTVRLTDMND
jgi:hypothetical protein